MKPLDAFVDRTARRPSGQTGRRMYTDPVDHEPSFRLALDLADLRPGDRVVELGPGGGSLLERVLLVADRATGVDHSADMLALSAERNAAAVAEGRLLLLEGTAGALPVPDDSSTVVLATNVLFFLADPTPFLAEAARVLQHGGRLVVVTHPRPRLRQWLRFGAWYQAMHFHSDAELAALLEQAGFRDVRVVTHDPLHQTARGTLP